MTLTPRQLNLPHDEWRPGQYEAVQAIQRSKKRVVLLDAPTGSGKCIDVNTLVSTPNGLKKVGSLKVGDKITSVSERGKSSYDVVSHVFPIEVKDAIEIKTRYGYSVTCTGDHAVLTWDGTFTWKLSSELSAGDYLCVAHDGFFPDNDIDLSEFRYEPRKCTNMTRLNLPTLPTSLDEDWAYFVGLLIGDGACGAKTSLKITTEENEIDSFVRDFCNKIGLVASAPYQSKSNAWDITISSVVLRDFLSFIGVGRKKSIDKSIPWVILDGTKPVVVAFLRGLFDTDGSIHDRGFEYGSSSKQLAEQVHVLLLKFGITSSLKYRQKTNSYRVMVSGLSLRTLKDEIGFRLTRKSTKLDSVCSVKTNTNVEVIPHMRDHLFGMYKNFRDYCHQIGLPFYKEIAKRGSNKSTINAYIYNGKRKALNPSREKLSQLLNIMNEVAPQELIDLNNSDIFFDPIVSINRVPKIETVDISVLGNNNFIAGGVVTHNSALGLALGSFGKTVRAVMITKALQNQYANYPLTEALFGLNNYDCALLDGAFTADACAFAHDMGKCPMVGMNKCDYVNQRNRTKMSPRQALSYPYYFLSSWTKKEDGVVDYLYCDEAHHLPQAIMNFMTFEAQPHQLSKMGLEQFPKMPEPQIARRAMVLSWLEYTIDKAQAEVDYLNGVQDKSIGMIAKTRYLTSLLNNARTTYNAMNESGDDFYIELMDNGGLRIFPLTPAPFFWNVFNVPEETKIVLASATIGNHKQFAQLLGIGNDYESHVVPPVYPPHSQPIYVYEDAPRMSYKSTDFDYKKQVEIIDSIIQKFPDDAHGLVHFVSIATAKRFAEMLAPKYKNRIWMPDANHNTEEKLAAWEERINTHPGTICLSWSFSTGVDAPKISWCVVQKIPFMTLDVVGKQLMERNKRLYAWFAGVTAEQACGRIRRGDPSHYEVPGEPLRKYVAIIDGNWTRVKSFFSDHFRDQITKVSI